MRSKKEAEPEGKILQIAEQKLKKTEKKLISAEKRFVKKEERALRIFSLTIRKKHYFALVLPIVIFFIGLSKIDTIEKAGKSVPFFVVLLAVALCIALSFFVYHKENKRISVWFVFRPYLIIAIPLIAIMLLFGHAFLHALFVAFLTVSFGFWIYHIH